MERNIYNYIFTYISPLFCVFRCCCSCVFSLKRGISISRKRKDNLSSDSGWPYIHCMKASKLKIPRKKKHLFIFQWRTTNFRSTQMRFLHVKVWCIHSFEEKMIEISLIPLANPTTRMNKYPAKKGTSPFWMHMVSFFGKGCKPFRVPQKKTDWKLKMSQKDPFKTVVSPFRMENGEVSI